MSVAVIKVNVDVGNKILTAEGTIMDTGPDHCWSWIARKRGTDPLVFTGGDVMHARDLPKYVEAAVLQYLERNIPGLSEAFK